MLPSECLPTEPSYGGLSFTLRAPNGAVGEVLLSRKAFFYKKSQGGVPFDGPRTKRWSAHPSVERAWEVVTSDLWWDEPEPDL